MVLMRESGSSTQTGAEAAAAVADAATKED